MNDFQTRAQSMVLGGNDFITKPFVVMELTLKSMMHMIRAQLQALESTPCAVA
jgi:DNA-binding response OmpR family regulator